MGVARKIWTTTSWDEFPCWLGHVFGQSPAGNHGSETAAQEDRAVCWVLLVAEGRLGEMLAQGHGTISSLVGAWVQALDTEPGVPLLFFPMGGCPDPALSVPSECAVSC